MRSDIDGLLIERWFLKTTINVVIAQKNPEMRWALTNTAVQEVPPSLVQAGFGRTTLSRPMGLYSAIAPAGERVIVQETMAFAPLLKNENRLIGGLFTFADLGSSYMSRRNRYLQDWNCPTRPTRECASGILDISITIFSAFDGR